MTQLQDLIKASAKVYADPTFTDPEYGDEAGKRWRDRLFSSEDACAMTAMATDQLVFASAGCERTFQRPMADIHLDPKVRDMRGTWNEQDLDVLKRDLRQEGVVRDRRYRGSVWVPRESRSKSGRISWVRQPREFVTREFRICHYDGILVRFAFGMEPVNPT